MQSHVTVCDHLYYHTIILYRKIMHYVFWFVYREMKMNSNPKTLVRNVVHIGFANDVLFGFALNKDSYAAAKIFPLPPTVMN